jgi:predicted NBD/HSP70 family sugar kinase
VGTLTVQLIRNGLIRHLGTGPSRGGRRPSFMEFNSRYGFVAGIALEPSKTRVALADLRGDRLATRVWPTPIGLAPAPLLAKVAGWLKSLLSEAGISTDKLLAVAAAAPGAVDHEQGIVMHLAPNLKGWEQVPMAALLKESLGGVPVVVENDVNLAILGERWRGAAVGHNTCAFVYAGTGIGAGIVVNGELHRGHHHLAGEIGLMMMGPQYLDQDFSSAGCLESLAGLKAVSAQRPAAGTATTREKKAEGAKAERRSRIGIATTNLALTIDPSLVVLAGPVAENEAFLEEVRRIVRKIIPSPPDIVFAKLGEEAPLWGSLLVATNEARASLRQRLRA